MFSTVDYAILVCLLVLSVLIGLYFGCFVKKRNTPDEYLTGSKTMDAVPVALSLIASNISGVTMLAIPPDVYLHGASYFFMAIPILLSPVASCLLYLPVIVNLKSFNAYDYLNLRFNRSIQNFAAFIFVLQVLLINPVVAYLPAVAFSQVTNVDVHMVTSLMCLVCIFYTTIGGFKTVIWTDVLQLLGMVVSATLIVYFGVSSLGGFSTLWEKARNGDRSDFDFSLDPTVRENFWSITIGGFVLRLNNGMFNPAAVQKYLSISNRRNAKWSALAMGVGVAFFTVMATITGFIIYAKYEGCDPMSSGQIQHADQLLPYYVISIIRIIPGLSCVFIVGLFCASLSSLSSSFNTLGAVIYGNFVVPHVSVDISQKSAGNILKLIVVASGSICIVLTFAVDKLGGLLSYVNASMCCVSGLLVGLFSLGMLFPVANSKGAFWGTFVSFFVTFWITSCHEWYKLKGAFKHFVKPLSVDNCSFPFNYTSAVSVADVDEPFVLYRLSYWYNSFIGAFVLIIIGLVVSWCTKPDKKVDRKLISPVCRSFLKMQTVDCDVDYCDKDVEMTTYAFNK